MKKIMAVLEWLSFAFFIILLGWGETIKQFNQYIYFSMAIVFAVGMASNIWKSQRERDRSIANRAVSEYKKENGIDD